MSDDKAHLPDITAIFDQAETHMENTAKMLATYYKSLRKNGVPAKLANELVLDFQRILYVMNKNTPQ